MRVASPSLSTNELPFSALDRSGHLYCLRRRVVSALPTVSRGRRRPVEIQNREESGFRGGEITRGRLARGKQRMGGKGDREVVQDDKRLTR